MTGRFTLAIDIGSPAMLTPQAVAQAIRAVSLDLDKRFTSSRDRFEGDIHDNFGARVGSWRYEVTP